MEVGSRYTDEEWSQTLMTVSEFINKYVSNEVCCSTPAASCSRGRERVACVGRITSLRHQGRFWRSQEIILEGPVVRRLASARKAGCMGPISGPFVF